MKAKLQYWDRKKHDPTKSEIKRVEVWEDNKVNLFKKFYKSNYSVKYLKGTYYKFEDEILEKEYKEWYNNLDVYFKNYVL